MRTRILRHRDHKQHKEVVKLALEERFSAHDFYYEGSELYCEHDPEREAQMDQVRAFATGALYASRIQKESYENAD